MGTCSSNAVCPCNTNWDCAGHRLACSTNRQLSVAWDGDLDGELINSALLDDLRTKIRSEVEARNVNENYNITLRESTDYTGLIIDNTHFNNLDLMMTAMYGSGLVDQNGGEVILDDEWDDLIARYNIIRQQCICNTDCACNTDCTCNTDCICNYSDERLKDEIEYC